MGIKRYSLRNELKAFCLCQPGFSSSTMRFHSIFSIFLFAIWQSASHFFYTPWTLLLLKDQCVPLGHSAMHVENSSTCIALWNCVCESRFKDLDSHAQADRAFKAARLEHNEFMAKLTPLAWEQELHSIIASPPCTRSIHWFVDMIGETGKTINAKSLYFNHQAFYCTGGKASDIAHAYQYQPIVVFNLVASQDKETQAYLYTVLEQFKDGIFSSGKYNSMIKTFKIPHVIVMSNEWPDETRMKKSRIVVHNIQELMHPHDFSVPN
jgi:hypothetical protein